MQGNEYRYTDVRYPNNSGAEQLALDASTALATTDGTKRAIEEPSFPFEYLSEIASEKNSTIILPVPIGLFEPYLRARSGTESSTHSGNGSPKPPRVRRKEEEEAERLLHEEAGGERPKGQVPTKA
jgi:hypothetical protein